MPANPDHIKRREVLSDDYQEEKVHIDFYSNNTIRIYRADPDSHAPDDDAIDKGQAVWLDNLEKRELLKVLDNDG
jgi:hypothetical protein